MEEDIKLNKKEIFEALYILCTNNKKHTYGSIPYEKIYEQLVDYIEQLEKENRELTEGCKTCVVRNTLNDYVENSILKTKISKMLDEQYELWNSPERQKEYSVEIVDTLEELLEDN